jgi:gamma-glutamyltranspeptidase
MTVAIAVWFGLPTNPAEAYFLNEEEKEMMRLRYAQRKQYMGDEEFSWVEIRIAFTDPKLYTRQAPVLQM